MDLQQLKLFINVASLKSFSRTADLMYTSQPNVSARIKALEVELGVILFDRSRSRELALTEAGRIYFDYAQKILNLQQEAEARLSEKPETVSGIVQIGAGTVPGTYLLPPLLARFSLQHPETAVHLNILGSAGVLERLAAYDFDFGVVGNRFQDDRFEFVPLAQDELLLVTPRGLFSTADLAPDGEVYLEQCLSHHFLVREKESATRAVIEKALAEKGAHLSDFSSLIYINSLEGIKQGVRHGMGISIISRYAAEDYQKLGLIDSFRIADLELYRCLYLVYHENRVLSRAAAALRDFIVQTIAS